MVRRVSESTPERAPLSRERVLDRAMAIADAGGIGSLTIRSLAQELGVKPMSVSHYVANKDEIIDGIVATLRHLDAVIACLRGAGFSIEMTAHALALVDSYVFGFALSEAALPIHGPESVPEVAEAIMQRFSTGAYTHLLEFATEHVVKPGYDFGEEFEFGLGLVLDALAERAKSRRTTRGRARSTTRGRARSTTKG